MAIIEQNKAGTTIMPHSARPFYQAGVFANGDFNGQAIKGALGIDETNGRIYQNTGTLAATVWTILTQP